MHERSRKTIALGVGIAVLAAGGAAYSAAGLSPSLSGAWTTSPQDCNKLFQRQGRAITYRRPVDKFAQAAIIEPGRIATPSSVCQVLGVTSDQGALKIGAECRDSISFMHVTAYLKVNADGQMTYSPTGDPSLATTLTRCKL